MFVLQLLIFCTVASFGLDREEARYALELSEIAYQRFPNEHVYRSTPPDNSDVPTYGIVLKELNQRQQIFLAFKGTDTVEDLKVDFYKSAAKLNEELDIMIHEGMHAVFQKVKRKIIEQLFKVWNSDNLFESEAPLIITGHSLGGGLAQILGAYLKHDGFLNSEVEKIVLPRLEGDGLYCLKGCYRRWYAKTMTNFKTFLKNSKMYTFGSPQVFRLNERSIPEWTTSLGKSSFHFVNENDPVPLLNLLDGREPFEKLTKEGLKEFYSLISKPRELVTKGINAWIGNKDYAWKEWGDVFYFKGSKWEKFSLIQLEDIAKGAFSLKDFVLNFPTAIQNINFKGALRNIKFHFLAEYKENFESFQV